MSTPDNRPSDATADSGKQADLADTLNSIMAQLTSIGSRLNLQGITLAHHTQLLDSTEGSNPPVTTTGGITSGTADGAFQPNHHRDNHVDLRNSFHMPKLNFPRYDGATDPLPWLNHCESYAGHIPWQQNKFVWPLCILTTWPLNGITPLRRNMDYSRGPASRVH
jgi:hypothetical protein